MKNPTPSQEIVIVPFYADSLEAIRDEDGVWLSLPRACANIGVQEQRQISKLRNKPWAVVHLKYTTDARGLIRETYCLHLDSVAMWLATIEASRVKPEMRATLERYQIECAKVLRDHFLGKPSPAPAPSPAPSVSSSTGARTLVDYAMETLGMAQEAGLLNGKQATMRRVALLRDRGLDLLPDPRFLFDAGELADAVEALKPGQAVRITKPIDTEGYYNATALGKPYGVSARKVGEIARTLEIHGVEGYGIYRRFESNDNRGSGFDHWMYSERAKEILDPYLAAVGSPHPN